MTTQKKERSKQPVWRGHSCPPLSAHHLFDVGASVRARAIMKLAEPKAHELYRFPKETDFEWSSALVPHENR
jgi:hypothetical protein